MFAFAAIGTTLEGMRNAVLDFIDVCNLLDRQRTTHLPYSTELLNGLFSSQTLEMPPHLCRQHCATALCRALVPVMDFTGS